MKAVFLCDAGIHHLSDDNDEGFCYTGSETA